LVRHFTLLKEVDAKIFAPEAALFQLVDAALKAPAPDRARSINDVSSSAVPGSTPMSVQNSSAGSAPNAYAPAAMSSGDSVNAAIFDESTIPRRQIFRNTALRIQEMLVSLEEKNHVISTANDALHKQLARIDEIWPHLENEFSEEAKWGSNTHWAYVENRPSKTAHTQAERSRRDGAAALSAAAQQLAEEAAARSSDRKQALAAKKNSKVAQQAAGEAESDGKPQESGKKAQGTGKSRKHATTNNNEAATPVGLGISTTPSSNGTAPTKRRKVAAETAKTNGGAPMERAMSSVFGTSAQKPKTTSPRETPVPEAPSTKKRKALPTSSGQAKKSRTNAAMSPSVASSPLIANFPDAAKPGRSSPVPLPVLPRPSSSRARQQSAQANGDAAATPAARQRPASAASNKPNGVTPVTIPDVGPQSNGAKSTTETKAQKEPAAESAPTNKKTEQVKAEAEAQPPPPTPPEPPVQNGGGAKKESVHIIKETTATEVRETKVESATPVPPPTPVAIPVTTTKSGRASKPSTPALATFAEAASSANTTRTRPSRSNTESNSSGAGAGTTTTSKRSHKKGASVSAASAAAAMSQAQQQQTQPPIPQVQQVLVQTSTIAIASRGGTADAAESPQPRQQPSQPQPRSSSTKKSAQQQQQQHLQQQMQRRQQQMVENATTTNPAGGNNINADDDDDDDADDVDEQRYCFCNGVSYGEMVACDGDGCPREWFHLECVGLKVAPKGNAKWYCDECKKRLRITERR